jgi:glycosyltransferase involved in cell wall biosynthesis
MNKIKIMHVYKSFNVYNGLIEILMILIRHINHDKYEISICVNEYEESNYGKEFEKLGGKIYNLNIRPHLYNETVTFFKLIEKIKEVKPDIVQTHVLKANLIGVLAAKMAGVKKIIATEMTLKDIAETGIKRFRDKLIHPLSALVINRCSMFMVTSESIKDEWNKCIHPEKIHVVYPPFNINKYNVLTNNRIYRDNSVKKVGFVGRLSKEKSVDTLINAFEIIRKKKTDVELLIVGQGSEKNMLINMTVKKGLEKHIHFSGYQENVFHFLNQMDILVLPSRTEGCPMVIIEAMASGLPIVATNVGGNVELVLHNETGFLTPVNNALKMSEYIIYLLEHVEIAKKMGELGKKKAFEKYHPTIFVNEIEKLYNQVI